MALATIGGTRQALLGSAPSPQRTAGRDGISAPYHGRIGAALQDRRMQPCNGLLINDVDATVRPSLAATMSTFMPGFTLAQLSIMSATAIAACLGIKRNRTHEFLQLAVQGSTFKVDCGA